MELSIDNFHRGEHELQDETGKRALISRASKTMMRDYMSDEHRVFFQGLDYIFIGTVDGQGQPWASVLSGPKGFATAPDSRNLQISLSTPLADPAFAGLQPGSPVGVLGLDFSNRRRNRMHGRVAQLNDDKLVITVSQSYGNCPKYINTRVLDNTQPRPTRGAIIERDHLNRDDLARIARADTFFIASHHHDGSGASYEGTDMSHRGGIPGFVQVSDGNTLTVPDYFGNFLFNTLGNLLVEPKAGLLFIDFDTGDLMQLSGTAEVIREDAEIEEYLGAHRLLRVHVNHVLHTPGGLPLRWQFLESSPFNPVPSDRQSK